MRLHRFYINQEINGKSLTILEERLLNQWKNVFRYKPGDRVVLFNGDGKEYVGELKDLKKREARIEIQEEKEGIKLERNITLYQSLIKKDNMEWVVEKGTELGVTKIVPIISERSEKKGFNVERANKIAVEASEQCGRADVPEIAEIVDLAEALDKAENIIVFDGAGESLELLADSYKLKPLSLFIGPEGGWSDKEMERFTSLAESRQEEAKTKIFSLGKLTLRAETAVISALSRFL